MKLVRNPNWSRRTDYRPAYVDEIEVKEGFTDTSVGVRQILNGTADGAGDYGVIPGADPEAVPDEREVRGQPLLLAERHRLPRAQHEEEALRQPQRPASGELRDGQERHPPGRPAGRHRQDRYARARPGVQGQGLRGRRRLAFDPYKTPNHSGSVAKAKAEMRKAGYANGMYDGPAITMYTFNSTPVASAGQGRRSEPREDRNQGEHQARLDRRDVHEVLCRGAVPARDLHARMAAGLQGSGDDARSALQREGDQPELHEQRPRSSTIRR